MADVSLGLRDVDTKLDVDLCLLEGKRALLSLETLMDLGTPETRLYNLFATSPETDPEKFSMARNSPQ